jgi:hypothetical protein
MMDFKVLEILKIITFIWGTKKKTDYHLSYYPSGEVLLAAFPVGSDSQY